MQLRSILVYHWYYENRDWGKTVRLCDWKGDHWQLSKHLSYGWFPQADCNLWYSVEFLFQNELRLSDQQLHSQLDEYLPKSSPGHFLKDALRWLTEFAR